MPIATAPPVESDGSLSGARIGSHRRSRWLLLEAQLANKPTLNKATAAIMKRRIGFPHLFNGTTLVDPAADTISNRQPRT